MLTLIVIAVLIIYIFILRNMNKDKGTTGNRRIESLKNGLLSCALAQVKKDDFDMFNMAYKTYDGTKLPSMSGCSQVNAYTSYIIDRKEFSKSPWYTSHMESKLDAIDKYLDTHFATDEQVIDFIEAFIDNIKKLPNPEI
jgi:hypothetical protein